MVAKPIDESDSQQKAIIVLGMHRSGTSAMAGVLRILGVDLGPKLMGAAWENRKGFWEHQEIVDIHDALLHWMGLSWDYVGPFPEEWWLDRGVEKFRSTISQIIRRDFHAATLWGFKDPRLCRLLPLWEDVFAELEVNPHFVHIIRDPLEVAASLKRRNDFSHEKSLTLWALHVLEAEEHTRHYPRVFLSFQQLLEDPESVMKRVAHVLAIDWPTPFSEVAHEIQRFLSPQLRHFKEARTNKSSISEMPTFVKETYEGLLAVCATGRAEENGFLDQGRNALNAYMNSWPVRALSRDLLSLRKQTSAEIANRTAAIQEKDKFIVSLTGRLEDLEKEIAAMRGQVIQASLEAEELRKKTEQDQNTIAGLKSAIAERDAQIAQLQEWLRADEGERERVQTELT
ncbi:MAG: sulfotransferase, partial [Desulfomonilaceae bacterium]